MTLTGDITCGRLSIISVARPLSSVQCIWLQPGHVLAIISIEIVNKFLINISKGIMSHNIYLFLTMSWKYASL